MGLRTVGRVGGLGGDGDNRRLVWWISRFLVEWLLTVVFSIVRERTPCFHPYQSGGYEGDPRFLTGWTLGSENRVKVVSKTINGIGVGGSFIIYSNFEKYRFL